jgi:peptidoglycan/xylan/chitin deacetylase (PgdA/CDA1 family)
VPMFNKPPLSLALLASILLARSAVAEPGATHIAKWRDDRAAAFLLMFDDSCPSHFQVAAPELAKRNMVATFYINPGKAEYTKFAKEWAEKLWKQGLVYGNHTMTHKGANDVDEARREITECTKVILTTVPGRTPRLISWGMPGVKTWNVTQEQLADILASENLVDRPPFHLQGVVYHLKTAEQMLAFADKAIKEKGMEYIIFHGVERIEPKWSYQDFWALKQDIFLPLLDALKQRQDRGELWITDHISYHKYERERDGGTVKVLESTGQKIVVELSAKTDPALYDLPLTLVTEVPAEWTTVKVTQDETATIVAVNDGLVKYPAMPSGEAVTIAPER